MDKYSQYSQQSEQIIATIFTCRSIVKYNLTLNELQKSDLLHDIDAALELLRSQLILNGTAPDKNMTAPNVQSHGKLLPMTEGKSTIEKKEHTNADQTLQALYRMYYGYLDTQQTSSIGTFVTRFNDAMITINDLQRLLEARYGSYESFVAQIPAADPLQRIRVFIADIYYIFMEFMHLLSEALQQNNMHRDTEKLSSMREEHGVPLLPTMGISREKEASSEVQYNIAQLARAYVNHQQLNKLKGQLSIRVAEGTAFLAFIKELSTGTSSKNEEILTQLNKLTKMLSEMQCLLVDYERAASLLLQANQ